MVPNSSPPDQPLRPGIQFSLQSLMIVTALVACGLAAWKMAGPQLFSQYFLLVYGAGPWFAYLVGECLPIRTRVVRIGVANALLVAMFILGLRLCESWFGWQAVVYVTAITGLVWTPQYMAFFYRRAAGI